MIRATLGLLGLSTALAPACLTHGGAIGVLLPDPDPAPAQAAQERFHQSIRSGPFLAAASSIGACLLSGLIACGLALGREFPSR